MPSPARVLIAFASAEPDQMAATSLAEGFTRDGIEVTRAGSVDGVLELLDASRPPQLVVASVHLDGDDAAGLALIRAVRDKHGRGKTPELARPPIIAVGDADRRAGALGAGASAFIARPAFVKDIVTLSHILAAPREGLEPGWGGQLGALHLYYMVRALGAAGRSGVLTLLRGGRRGELRFFEGEVTSAQVGTLHGQSAFHQLLLWPEAHYDLRVENVVRREQIPLTPAELLQDAERFLRDFNEIAAGLSPAAKYTQELSLAREEAAKIPPEAMPVLRLFDSSRTVADIIEDSPMRMPETLKVVRNLIALGAIRKMGAPRAQPDAGTALLVEDWLVGQPAPDVVAEERAEESGKPTAGDWGDLASESLGGLAPVVPAKSTTGEIQSVAVTEEAADESGNGAAATGGVAETVERKRKNKRGRRLPAVVVEDGEGVEVVPSTRTSTGTGTGAARKFEEHEEKFFEEEERFSSAEHPVVETFADLDEGGAAKPEGFWKRLFRRWRKTSPGSSRA